MEELDDIKSSAGEYTPIDDNFLEDLKAQEQSSLSKAWNVTDKGTQYWLRSEATEPYTGAKRWLSTVPLGPEILGLYGAGRGLAVGVGEWVPYVRKFMTEGHRRAFSELSTKEQAYSLLFDGAEVLAGVAIKPALELASKVGPLAKIGRALSYDFTKPIKKLTGRKLSVDPEEIAQKLNPFDYDRTATAHLEAQGLDEVESRAVADVLQGGSGERLKDVFIEKGPKVSEKFKSYVELNTALGRKNLVELKLNEDVKEALSMNRLHAEHHKVAILDEIKKLDLVGAKDFNKHTAEAFYRHQAHKFLGEDALKMTLGEAPDELISSFLIDAAKHPKDLTRLTAPGGAHWPEWFSPHRFTFGIGEQTYRTKTMVYDKATRATELVGMGVHKAALKWNEILKSEGLLSEVNIKRSKLTGGQYIEATASAEFTPEVAKKGMKLIQRLDNIAEKMSTVTDPEQLNILRLKHTVHLQQTMGPDAGTVGRFVRSWRKMSDWLYGNRFEFAIPKIFEDAGIKVVTKSGKKRFIPIGFNAVGRRAVTQILADEAGPIINKHFLGKDTYSFAENQDAAKRVLNIFRDKLKNAQDYHPWFDSRGKELNASLTKLDKALELAPSHNSQGYMSYLESYMPRVARSRAQEVGNSMIELLHSNKNKEFRPSYTHERSVKSEGILERTFEEMFASRIKAHYNEQYFYPAIKEIVDYSQHLPRSWRGTIAHYLGRAMGQPTWIDEKFASLLEKTWGKLPFAPSEYDAGTAMRLGQVLTNMSYAAGIAFRPFSVMRNLLQVPLNVPADLGGLRAWEHMVGGYYDLAKGAGKFGIHKGAELLGISKETFKPNAIMEELRGAKIITEFAPDISIRPNVLPWGAHTLKLGKSTYLNYGLQDILKTGMWMFQKADEANRLVTGAAALRKWYSASHLLDKADDLASFARKAGLHGRNPHVRDEVLSDIRKAKLNPIVAEREATIKEARNKFIRDVVSDTQYLYGKMESPIAIGYGGVGLVAGQYQSWWMNYGALLTKWTRTGDVPLKASRLFSWMLASALSAEFMARYWGNERAAQTVGFGPFPTQDLPVPPSWHVVGSAIGLAAEAGSFLTGTPSKAAIKRAKALIDAPLPAIGKFTTDEVTANMPAGVISRRLLRHYQTEREPNIFRAIMEMESEEKLRKSTTPFKFAKGLID